MAAFRTEAFVLKTQDYRDTSLLATFYTLGAGKIKAVVKGGRDGRARFGSSFEPFSLNEILLYPRKRGDLHLVTEAELVDRFDAVRHDLERLGEAVYFTELVDQLTEEHDGGAEIFYLLKDALRFLGGGHSPKRAARIFEIKIMRSLGWLADVTKCLRCSADQEKNVYFSLSSGGTFCESCKRGEGELVPLLRGAMLFIDQALRKSFEALGPIKVAKETGENLEFVLRRYADFYLAYKPKSIVFLEKIGAA